MGKLQDIRIRDDFIAEHIDSKEISFIENDASKCFKHSQSNFLKCLECYLGLGWGVKISCIVVYTLQQNT